MGLVAMVGVGVDFVSLGFVVVVVDFGYGFCGYGGGGS